ncbi:ferredoxin [Paraburkholderia dipogonis]
MIKVELDQSTCCGSKMCASLAPGAFVLLESGVAGVLPGALDCPFEQLMKAAKSCPTQCITIFRDGEEVNLY